MLATSRESNWVHAYRGRSGGGSCKKGKTRVIILRLPEGERRGGA